MEIIYKIKKQDITLTLGKTEDENVIFISVKNNKTHLIYNRYILLSSLILNTFDKLQKYFETYHENMIFIEKNKSIVFQIIIKEDDMLSIETIDLQSINF